MIELRSKNGLFLSLFTITVVMIALPQIFAPSTHPTWIQFVVLVGVIGNAHVGMTAFFYLGDKRYKPILASEPWRYFWLPIALMGLAIVLFLYSEQGFWAYFMAHYAWLLWHFGRQNFGIYSFVAVGNKSGPVTQLERYYFGLLPIAAVLKAWTMYSQIGLTGPIVPALLSLSYALFAVCGGMLAAILVLQPNVRQDWQRVTALLLGFAFFAPTIISDNPAVALTFFAHSAQYVIIMLYLAGDRKQGSLMLRYAILLFSGLSLWAFLTTLQPWLLPLYLAVTYGISQAHFLIDAGVWRLKMAPQRAIVAESFDFLFGGAVKPKTVPASALAASR